MEQSGIAIGWSELDFLGATTFARQCRNLRRPTSVLVIVNHQLQRARIRYHLILQCGLSPRITQACTRGSTMAMRTTGWLAAFTLIGSLFSLNTLADGALFGLFNPLGLYIGAGVGQSNIGYTQFDDTGDSFRHRGSEPLGWNAVIGLRPIPFLGAEAEYIDFGNTSLGGRPIYSTTSEPQGALFGENHDRAATVSAVGYLPLPIPWMEPFAKLGWGEIWDHQHYEAAVVNGAAIFPPFTQSTHSNGVVYGGGIQFHFSQLAVRVQYEVISSSRSFGERDDPGLLSVGLNWTF
jgi:hypothetical protein